MPVAHASSHSHWEPQGLGKGYLLPPFSSLHLCPLTLQEKCLLEATVQVLIFPFSLDPQRPALTRVSVFPSELPPPLK